MSTTVYFANATPIDLAAIEVMGVSVKEAAMGVPLQRRSVQAMARRWRDDEARLQDLFNRGQPVDTDDLTDPGEMLRNLGSAIAHADAFLATTSGKE